MSIWVFGISNQLFIREKFLKGFNDNDNFADDYKNVEYKGS